MSNQSRILLVDDEPHIVKVAGKRLEMEGYAVTVAGDGQDALAKARGASFDLIILDLMLPKLNGYEVCTMLKQDAQHQHIPILMFTGKTQEKDRQLGAECGADAFLTKPFDGAALLTQIHALLHGGPSR